MVARRGSATVGCLLPVLLLVLAAYVGRDFGEAYFRYYKFRDAMRQDVRFAGFRSDDSITTHLRALADSLNLPRDAGEVRISHIRGGGAVIWSDYSETVRLPFNREKTIYFHPTSETSPVGQ